MGKGACKSLDGDSWAWETVAVILSLVIRGVTVLKLILIDNKKLLDWPLGITPNTLIFTISKWVEFSSRGRLRKDIGPFDEVSCGPWGSLLLIWRIKEV